MNYTHNSTGIFKLGNLLKKPKYLAWTLLGCKGFYSFADTGLTRFT